MLGCCKSCSDRPKSVSATTQYTQAEAEKSKDYVLGKVKDSTDKLEASLLLGYYSAIFTIAISLVIVLIILFIVIVLIMIRASIITPKKALIAFILWFIFVCLMATVFVVYCYRYTKKRINAAGEVYKNFISSEKIPVIVDTAAGVYVQNLST